MEQEKKKSSSLWIGLSVVIGFVIVFMVIAIAQTNKTFGWDSYVWGLVGLVLLGFGVAKIFKNFKWSSQENMSQPTTHQDKNEKEITNMQIEKQTSIWKKRWQWWQVILLGGYTYLIAHFISSGSISTTAEVMTSCIIWLVIFGFIIWRLKKD